MRNKNTYICFDTVRAYRPFVLLIYFAPNGRPYPPPTPRVRRPYDYFRKRVVVVPRNDVGFRRSRNDYLRDYVGKSSPFNDRYDYVTFISNKFITHVDRRLVVKTAVFAIDCTRRQIIDVRRTVYVPFIDRGNRSISVSGVFARRRKSSEN